MKFKKFSIKKYLADRKNSLSFFGGSYERDWNVIVILFSISFIALLVLAGFIYNSMISSNFPEDLNPTGQVNKASLNRDKVLIEKAEVYFEERAKLFESALKDERPLVDPSL